MRKPFSKQEKQILIETVNSGKSIRKTSPAIAKSMGRSEMSVSHKMYMIRKDLGLAPERKKRVTKTRKEAEVNTQAITANGFSFNFNPSRTEIHKDHVRLYF